MLILLTTEGWKAELAWSVVLAWRQTRTFIVFSQNRPAAPPYCHYLCCAALCGHLSNSWVLVYVFNVFKINFPSCLKNKKHCTNSMYMLINYNVNTSEQYRKEYVGFCCNVLPAKYGFHVPLRFEIIKVLPVMMSCAAILCCFFFKSCFWLVPTSMTLNDLERRNSLYFAFFSTEFDSFAGRLCHSGWR